MENMVLVFKLMNGDSEECEKTRGRNYTGVDTMLGYV